jgi:acetyltransferase-like isoleucine patch superfamily enzyme
MGQSLPDMKVSVILCFLLLASFFCYSQKLGVGFGTNGINVKTAPFNKLRFIGRVSPTFSNDFTVVNCSVEIGRNFIIEEHASLYAGLGAGTVFTEASKIVDEDKWFLTIPIGLEIFPFSARIISFAAEAGPQFDYENLNRYPGKPSWTISPKGLIEFSYYF